MCLLALGRKVGKHQRGQTRSYWGHSHEACHEGRQDWDNGAGEGGSWADLRYALEHKTHLADGSWIERGTIEMAECSGLTGSVDGSPLIKFGKEGAKSLGDKSIRSGTRQA